MINKGRVSPFLLILILLLSQSVVFAQETDRYAVEITGPGVENELKLTLEQLEALPEEAQIQEEYLYNSKSGEKSVEVKGVSLAYIIKEKAGVTAENAQVSMLASDGYEIPAQSLQDILDPQLKYVLAYEVNGEAVDNDDNPDNEEITLYRKVKEEGEFGTVFKLVVKITVGESLEAVDITPEVSPSPQKEDAQVYTDISEEYKFAATAIQELSKKGIISGMGEGKYAPQNNFTRAQFSTVMVKTLGYEPREYKESFTDVKGDDWFAPYVQAAVDAGILTGYSDNSFKPNEIINRQELASVVGRGAVASGIVEQSKLDKFIMEKSNFTDKDMVPEWAANEVAWLEAQGFFSQITAEKFEPTKKVNRAEAAVIVYEALLK